MKGQGGVKDESSCRRLLSGNSTKEFELEHGWEGIPFNFLVNSAVFFVILTLYVLLRRRARVLDARRPASIGWLQFIYGDRYPAARPSFVTKHGEHHHKHEHNTRLLLPPTVSQKLLSPSIVIDMRLDNMSGIENAGTSCNPFKCCYTCLSKLLYRIIRVIRIRDEDMEAKRGSDAVQYLMFERYMIYYLIMLSTVCVLVILPINMSGTVHRPNGRYARTTVENIDMSEDYASLWAHAIISVLMLPLAVILMSHFNEKIKSKSTSVARRTLFIRHIPHDKVNKEQIVQFMESKFPDIVIEGIQLVYAIRRLRKLHNNLISVQNAIGQVWKFIEETNCRYEMRPYSLGQFGGLCCCCCFCPKVDGMLYFREEELRLKRMLANEFKRTIDTPTGSLFITFGTEAMAQKVNKYFNRKTKKLISWIPFLSLIRKHDDLKSRSWIVSLAPNPEDVNWNDVTASNAQKWARRAAVYFFILLIFIFLSTPLIVVQYLQYSEFFASTLDRLSETSPLLKGYLQPLLLVITASIMPALVMWISSYLPCERRSELSHSTMWNVYLFYMFMVLVLPSLGLASSRQMLESFASDKPFRWECAFPVDNGAFFINYILQSAFIGTAFELLHFSELLQYFYEAIFYTYCSAEYENVKQEVTFDFTFGTRYPKFLLIFCTVGAYCMSCPLIAPVGLLFMAMKHLIDKYNIFYVYEPVKINDDIHETATTFFYIGVFFMQIQVFLISFLRTGYSDITGFTILCLLFSSLILTMKCCCACLPSLTDIMRLRRKPPASEKKEYCACLYMPPVLYDLNDMKVNPRKSKKNNRKGA